MSTAGAIPSAVKKTNAVVVFVAVLASVLEIIDTSIVNVAIPTMMGNLGATLEDISMVITGYAIANAIVLPLSGWLSARFGRRRYYLTCIALFTATSVACGLAPNLTVLIICRILQGLAGGALLPTSQAMIFEEFPREKAGMAGAIFGMSVMVGPALGPVMGGYLTDNFGWRSIFNINLPLGLLALFMGARAIHDPEHEKQNSGDAPRTFDAVGLGLLCAGIGCLQYVLERGEADDWFSSSAIVVNCIIATIAIPSFVWWELKTKNPVLEVRLFLEPIVRNGVLLIGAVGFALYGVVFMLPVFVGRTLHYTATQTGSLFLPGSILTAAMMPFVGRSMQAGLSPKILMLIGFSVFECFLFSLTMLSPLSSREQLLHYLYIRGFAMAFLFVPINSAILSQFQGKALGQVSGMMNLFRQLGGSIGIALVGTLFGSLQKQNYLDLASHVSALDANTYGYVSGLAQSLAGKFSSAIGTGSAQLAALKLLQFRVENQAFMLSFLQIVWTMICLLGLVGIPLWRLKLKRKPTGPIDAH